ncbi:flagellar hook-associated protein FlgL [Hydrogenophaga sp. PBL-H3]|uniref:flagellar hook-associated protein FlgL n=1 Tax=Hydrogenophaga sp. PBL-H3 TaxID=434010 RepID=UPI00132024DE|nr:flagellar hook-associated protein FlgL [Hydrogenophaga sp. PBL-H3]QHE77625.1 flagellar hook-associated protein 3 [Hydrogenophaga sp. PBL-H3]QHE82049.1 flagellar hook-associated protein 3 [Hydrogenophaga sp. PBL-H3]
MRVSTANSYDNTVSLLARRQAELAAQQEKIATGKRVLKPSDDPVAATLAETAQNRLSRTQADLRSLETARSSLQQAESGLAESGELIQKVRDLLVSAGNATFGPSEREDIARQLEGLREQLIGVANLKDNSGRTLFGGLGGAATPFVDLYGPGGNGVQFSGQRGQAAAGSTSLPQALDGNAIWMRVPQGNGSFSISLGAGNTGGVSTSVGEVIDPSALTGDNYRIDFADVGGVKQYTVTNLTTPAANPMPGQTGVAYTSGMTIEFDGQSFQLNGQPAAGDQIDLAPSGKTDIFSVVQGAVDALRYTGANSSAQRTQELARATTELDAGHDRVLLARGRAGEWLNRADSLDTLLEDRGVDLKEERSRLEDLDLVQGISDFQTQQLGLEAALKSYAQVQRLSLFQII